MSQCWVYDGPLSNGYGFIQIKRKTLYTHRLSYEALVGPIPEGLQLDHLCRNRACYNPSHLEPVTSAENSRRGALARTHCKQGHRWTEENTSTTKGYRVCRTCHREQEKNRYRRTVA